MNNEIQRAKSYFPRYKKGFVFMTNHTNSNE